MSKTDSGAPDLDLAAFQTELGEAKAELGALKTLVEEHEKSFALRWAADMRAIERWKAGNPSRDLTWPDHADLTVWLLGQVEKAEGDIRSVAAFIQAYNAKIATLRAIAQETAACCNKPVRMCGHDSARVTLKELGLPIKAGGV